MKMDSRSKGDESRFLDLESLQAGLLQLPTAPTDEGCLTRIMARAKGGERLLLNQATLSISEGLSGDAWYRDARRDPHAQLAVMQESVAQLVANGQPPELAGDNLWLDLDLSNDNLPTGSQVEIGEALLEVTPLPHNGCSKFRARFGPAALKFVNQHEFRARNLRGIYLRVIREGTVRVGDVAQVLRRGAQGF